CARDLGSRAYSHGYEYFFDFW
nr:immunoglobulin heavy chain junction region [Macaca mulatta]MOW18906.1 immunoglobulin heavy chain junction region [Macaca mulatta]MOW18989.1 immunoglobulin heavy chain junction region [Macaca mulatta]MOW19348.1 immunoglobulin heavy chain junction region [Macaca mulatta]MOW19886.1 immunoglobulin heavy chain junction region [Macaca mulatta]